MDWPRESPTGEQRCAGADRSRASPSMIDCSHTTFGFVDGRPVFMDVSDDSYFMLDPEEEAAFLASAGKECPGSRNLPAAGRPETRVARPLTPVQCARPSSTVLAIPQRRSRGTLLDAFHVWRLLLNVRWALRRRSIATVLSNCVSREFQSAEAEVAERAPRLAGRFARARRLVPIPGNCLTDSLALVRWLGEHGAGATLIFGVKLDPFAAHCWVQTDETLLNDHPERVERFSPVRAIECTRHTL